MKFPVYAVAAAALVLCGCQIGPKYVRPVVQSPPAFEELRGNDEWKVATPTEANSVDRLSMNG